MKIISWNVAGLRACITKGCIDFFNEENPDIICLQEIKMREDQLTVDIPNYQYKYWNSAVKNGYSGTLIMSKIKPLNVTYGINIEEHDQEGRVITAEFEQYYLITVYTPNSKQMLERLDYRMKWEDDFLNYINNLNTKKPVILCGDLNVAHKEIDLKNPKTNTRSAGFTIEERNKFTQLLDNGYIDVFRYFYKDLEDAYTWWSYMGRARERNVGWRIDYFVVPNSFINNVGSSKIYSDIYGSDHAPVGIVLKDKRN